MCNCYKDIEFHAGFKYKAESVVPFDLTQIEIRYHKKGFKRTKEFYLDFVFCPLCGKKIEKEV